MNDDGSEAFFSRWSRRKAQVRRGVEPPSGDAQPVPPLAGKALAESEPAATAGQPPPAGSAAPAAAADPAAAAPPAPTLEEAQALLPGSDVSRFVAPGVDSRVRNAAVKQLFADPHFNVMDGLDTYIDDYNKADPIPKSMMRQLLQARMLGLLDDELEEQPVAATGPASAPVQAGPDDQPVLDPPAGRTEEIASAAEGDVPVPAQAPAAAGSHPPVPDGAAAASHLRAEVPGVLPGAGPVSGSA